MNIAALIVAVGLTSASSLYAVSIAGDMKKSQDVKRLFAEVSSTVDQYRAASCAGLPASLSVGDIFTAQGSVAPVGTNVWNVTFTNGWASIAITTLDAQDRSSLLRSFDGRQSGGVLFLTLPLRSYTAHNVTALNDRMTMEAHPVKGSYSYECY